MNDRLVLTDELLRQAFAKRMAQGPDPRLLERIVEGAASVPQARAPRGWLRRPRAGADAPTHGRWSSMPAFAGLVVAVAVTLSVILAIRQVSIGPGSTPSPNPTATPAASATPSEPPAPTPEEVPLGDHAALRLHLGNGFEPVDPIDVTFADGSIWTADIHANDVRRFDPASLELVAAIKVPSPAGGPAWFATTPAALWVSNQLGNGLTRIDPATNTVITTVGSGGTCGEPVVAFERVWQSICDSDTFLRIDATTNALETLPAEGHGFLVAAGDRFVTTDQDGLATLDPETLEFSPLPTTFRRLDALLGSDGETVWVLTDTGLVRVDPADGRSLVTFAYTNVTAVSFAGDHAWLSVGDVGLIEIDLATNQEVQTIPFPGSPLVPLEAAGALWVTDFDNSDLWRIEP
jgi:hypothetical protein